MGNSTANQIGDHRIVFVSGSEQSRSLLRSSLIMLDLIRCPQLAFHGKQVKMRAFVVGGVPPHGVGMVEDARGGGLTQDPSKRVREHHDYLTFMRAILEEGGGFTRYSGSRLNALLWSIDMPPIDRQKWLLNLERIFDIGTNHNTGKRHR